MFVEKFQKTLLIIIPGPFSFKLTKINIKLWFVVFGVFKSSCIEKKGLKEQGAIMKGCCEAMQSLLSIKFDHLSIFNFLFNFRATY